MQKPLPQHQHSSYCLSFGNMWYYYLWMCKTSGFVNCSSKIERKMRICWHRQQQPDHFLTIWPFFSLLCTYVVCRFVYLMPTSQFLLSYSSSVRQSFFCCYCCCFHLQSTCTHERRRKEDHQESKRIDKRTVSRV